MVGKVRWFNKHKGYGFITAENKMDVFFHYSVIEQDGKKFLKRNQIVYLQVQETNEGSKATTVKLLPEA